MKANTVFTKRMVTKGLIAGTALAAVICMAGCGTPKIDLNKYVEVTFSGYDGYGTAEVTLDTDAIMDDYGKKIKLSDEAEEWGDAEDFLDMCIYVGVDASDGLSDGDIVTLDWDVETSYLESALNAEFSYESEEYTVSGLEEIESFDAFENITVEFSGMSPEATAGIVCSDPDLYSSYFNVSPSEDLTIGDTVTVTISESSQEQMIQELGKVPEETSREYTVEGIAYYATTVDDIPEDVLAKMQAQAEDDRTAAAADWEEGATLTSMDYLGCYFLTRKEGHINGNKNILYLVYRINLNQMGTDLSYYWYIKYTNGIVMEDGTFSINYSDYETPGYGLFYGYDECVELTSEDGTTQEHAGFSDLDSMFNYLVIPYVDAYTYENTVEE